MHQKRETTGSNRPTRGGPRSAYCARGATTPRTQVLSRPSAQALPAGRASTMSGKIRILIVDDIAESRDNVAKLLRFEPDVEVVGTADNGEQAIELCERLDPHIVLMDVNMPGMDGITATTRITSRMPNTAVIMMSVQNEPEYLRRSMMAGAREFLAKPFSLDELIDSIRHVNQLAQQSRKVVTDVHVVHSSTGPARNRKAKIITLFSLKGGVGR